MIGGRGGGGNKDNARSGDYRAGHTHAQDGAPPSVARVGARGACAGGEGQKKRGVANSPSLFLGPRETRRLAHSAAARPASYAPKKAGFSARRRARTGGEGTGREDERGGRMSASGGLSEGWKEEKGPGPWKHTKTKGPPSHVPTGVRAASGQAARKRVRLKGGPFWLFGDTPSRQPPRAGAARAPPAPAPARAGFYQYWSTHGWCGRGGRGGGRRRAAACKVFLSHVNRPRSLLPFCAHLPRPARAPPRPQPVAVQ